MKTLNKTKQKQFAWVSLKERGDNNRQENLPDGSFNKYIKVFFIFLQF